MNNATKRSDEQEANMVKSMKENSILYDWKSLLHKDKERMLSGLRKLLKWMLKVSTYTEIAEVNLFAFLYRLFHEWSEIFMKQAVGKCK